MDTIDYPADAPVRIATETVVEDIDGVQTVIAQEGQPVPLAFAHLVPDELTVASEQDYIETRSTSGRRAAHAQRAAEQEAAGNGAGAEPVAASPLADPGSFTVEEVLAAFEDATPEEIEAAQAAEADGKNRKGIVEYEPAAPIEDE